LAAAAFLLLRAPGGERLGSRLAPEARNAEKPVTLPAALASRLAALSEHQKRLLERLKERAAPRERQLLDPYIEMCGRCCQWMRQAPQPTQDNGSAAPPVERWRRWRKQCPMNGGRGCR